MDITYRHGQITIRENSKVLEHLEVPDIHSDPLGLTFRRAMGPEWNVVVGAVVGGAIVVISPIRGKAPDLINVRKKKHIENKNNFRKWGQKYVGS